MKKLDKLVLRSFLGPFILTTFVVVFILLMQTMIKYFGEFVGKNLDWAVFIELFSYFSISLTPMALPLAVLLSSLMTFGNLGEHFELTAIKSAGISLLRVLRPIFVFVLLITFAACYSNMFVVPKANLTAYRLLYDIKQTEPAMNLKEGAFYNGLKGYSIKVNKKEKDGLLRDMIIYDHSKNNGNTNVIMADSGRMYTFANDRFMRLELHQGTRYSQGETTGKKQAGKPDQYTRYKFDKTEMVFSMASFDMKETDDKHFSRHRFMQTFNQLWVGRDSLYFDWIDARINGFGNVSRYHSYHLKGQVEAPEEMLAFKTEFEAKKQKRDSLKQVAALKRLAEEKDSLQAKTVAVKNEQGVKVNSSKKIDFTTDVAPADEDKKPLKEDRSKIIRDKKIRVTADEGKRSEKEEEKLVENKRKVKVTKVALNEAESPEPKADTVEEPETETVEEAEVRPWEKWSESEIEKLEKALAENSLEERAIRKAMDGSKYIIGSLKVRVNKEKRAKRNMFSFSHEAHKRVALGVACLIMFLIGAPIGSIIKKGGLGIPVLISILLFILFYVMLTSGEKWATEGVISPFLGAWLPNVILFPAGLFFMRQASKDARLLEADFYSVAFGKLKDKFRKKQA